MASAKSRDAYRTISEVSKILKVQPHILRFWESKFSQIQPLKRAGGRRYYSPGDIELLKRVASLLYKEGYTIKGVQRVLKKRRRAVFDDDLMDDKQILAPQDSLPLEGTSSHRHLVLDMLQQQKLRSLLGAIKKTMNNVRSK